RLAHLRHTLPHRRHVLPAQVPVQAERRLQLVNGLGRNPRHEDLVQSPQRVVIPLQPPHALLHRQPRLHRLAHRTHPRQRRQIPIAAVTLGVHHCSFARLNPLKLPFPAPLGYTPAPTCPNTPPNPPNPRRSPPPRWATKPRPPRKT